MASIPGYYTIQEAAPLLEKSEATVTRYCQTQRLRAFFTGTQWLIEQSALESFEEPKRGNPKWVSGYKPSKRKRRK